MIGRELSHYRILEQLGRGGMGEVYLAEDTQLDRRVALKILPPELAKSETRRARFTGEAKALASLNHPNIVAVHSIEDFAGLCFITMELVPGKTLGEVVPEKGLDLEVFFPLAIALADALAAAHRRGVVHRDLKPSNVMITPDSVVKVLDFGLAKVVQPYEIDPSASTKAKDFLTEEGVRVGTLGYMSPEQARGLPVDARSDVYSLGLVLIEMLTGRRPASRPSSTSKNTEAAGSAPEPLRRILDRCLHEEADRRYASAVELHRDLEACRERLVGRKLVLQRPISVLILLVVLLSLSASALWLWLKLSRERWARQTALPEVERLGDAGDHDAAFRLLREAEAYIPDDPELVELRRIWEARASIETTPAGAEVFVRGYGAIDSDWIPLGRSPIEEARIPILLSRIRITLSGHESLEGILYASPHAPVRRRYTLEPEGASPPGMAHVPGGAFALGRFPRVELSEYWIDEHEVTNRAFKEFIERGGYDEDTLWTHAFVESGRRLERSEAMSRFRDATGRRGPSGWEVGSYPEGEHDHPVRGVSWYEAAAYCESLGKRLPSVYHWYKASGARGSEVTPSSDMLAFANFGGSGPVSVGSHDSLGPYGTYDMAGNVKEWCSNETDGGHRFVAGGAWNEPSYRFMDFDAQGPLFRDETIGFRCVRALEARQATADDTDPFQIRLSLQDWVRDYSLEEPVPDELFSVFARLYDYERVELDAKLEEVTESRSWTQETVSLRSGTDRMNVHLFLPRDGQPPFQPVIYFPGYAAFFAGPGGGLEELYWEFLVRAGRAVVVPQWQGTYGRGDIRSPYRREMNFHFARDLGRTIDFLDTRTDLDSGKLAFYGLSIGAEKGVILSAVETRLRVIVLMAGGFSNRQFEPEVDPLNFAPRVTAPVLMVNGRNDFLLDYEKLQLPLFRLLGLREPAKRHAVFEAGHIPRRADFIQEILDWLDEHLGPVVG